MPTPPDPRPPAEDAPPKPAIEPRVWEKRGTCHQEISTFTSDPYDEIGVRGEIDTLIYSYPKYTAQIISALNGSEQPPVPVNVTEFNENTAEDILSLFDRDETDYYDLVKAKIDACCANAVAAALTASRNARFQTVEDVDALTMDVLRGRYADLKAAPKRTEKATFEMEVLSRYADPDHFGDAVAAIAPGWTSAGEPPTDSNLRLITILWGGKLEVIMATFFDGDWSDRSGFKLGKRVVAWMPLPAPFAERGAGRRGDVTSSAIISDCGKYRYTLSRIWDEAGTRCLFVMLNPSTADASVDDPTIRKCIKFAKAWGHGSLSVVNLFAWRATDPKEIRKVNSPVGPENDATIATIAALSNFIVCAWGNDGIYGNRDSAVIEILKRIGKPLHCLKINTAPSKSFGSPGHPLYIKDSTEPFVFRKGEPPGDHPERRHAGTPERKSAWLRIPRSNGPTTP